MTIPLTPFLLATIGSISYQILQKNVPAEAPPLLATSIAYAIGLASCMLAFTISGGWGTLNWRHVVNVPVIGVGVAIIGVELGYLLAYRAGGSLGNTALWITSLANASLLIIGIVWGQERLDLTRFTGIAFAMVGLVLMAR